MPTVSHSSIYTIIKYKFVTLTIDGDSYLEFF